MMKTQISILLLLCTHLLLGQTYINILQKQGGCSTFQLANTTLIFDSTGAVSVWENRERPSGVFSQADMYQIFFSTVTTSSISESLPSSCLFYQQGERLFLVDSSPSRVTIYNMYGQLLLHIDHYQDDGIDISTLDKGIYLLCRNGRSATFVK